METVKIISLSLLCAVAFTFCDTMAALWAKTGSRQALLFTLFLSPLGYLVFGLINTRIDLAVAGGLVNALIVTLTALSGVFILGQGTLNYSQMTGLAFILCGVVLVLR